MCRIEDGAWRRGGGASGGQLCHQMQVHGRSVHSEGSSSGAGESGLSGGANMWPSRWQCCRQCIGGRGSTSGQHNYLLRLQCIAVAADQRTRVRKRLKRRCGGKDGINLDAAEEGTDMQTPACTATACSITAVSPHRSAIVAAAALPPYLATNTQYLP